MIGHSNRRIKPIRSAHFLRGPDPFPIPFCLQASFLNLNVLLSGG